MKTSYGPSELLKNAWSLLLTRLCFPGARLIRRPAYIRGGKGIDLGAGFTSGYRLRAEVYDPREKRLIIGKNVKVGDNVHLVAGQRVVIGEGCLFASNIFVSDTDHGSYRGDEQDCAPNTPPDTRDLTCRPVEIGRNVWVGEGVCILPGATVGDGCVIGAHSVVKGVIPPGCIAAGSPARVIRRYENGHWSK